jgi:hypothetical protein
MVCALHRLFQSEEDDRIMEGDFDPEVEKRRREEERRSPTQQGVVTRLIQRVTRVSRHFVRMSF